MKFMIILLLVAATYAVDLQNSRNKQKQEGERTDKRESLEGISILDKRAPVISTVSPAITPGVEYADSKETQRDTSPTRQIYATPLPPVSKISDVLTGQGPPYQSAIASHLYAPISVYQPRLGAPTTYEISAPVPSNLAYSEHRVALQPSQNALQYSQKPIQKSKNIPQIFLQQSLAYQQPLGPVRQPIYQQIPLYSEGPLNNFQIPSYPVHQDVYQDQPVQIIQSVQPGITYQETAQENQQPQKEIKPQPDRKETEKQAVAQNHVRPQGAVSFARFSQLQPVPAHQPQQEQHQYQLTPQPQPQPLQQYQQQEEQPQHQQQVQYQQQQVQYQPQQIQYQPQQIQYQPQKIQYQPQQNQYQQQPLQYKLQAQPQYQQLVQPQIRYQPLPQYQLAPQFEPQQLQQSLVYQTPQPEQVHQQSQQQIQYQPQQQYQQQQPPLQHQPQPQPQLPPVPKQSSPTKQISFLRPGPVFLQSQFLQNHGAPDYRNNVALPTFPPVQYFGKYAQSIFGNHQH